MLLGWIITNALLGLIIGSFLNVVVIRANTGKTLLGRSGCLSCAAPLHVRHLIPIASWIFQRGRCATCGCRVSMQYPIVEAATALIFAFVAWGGYSLLLHPLLLIVVSLWVAAIAYDMRHTIIPDMWSFSAAGVALLFALLSRGPTALFDGVVVAAPLFALWFFSKGRAMGLGDPKLALSIGWVLGIVDGLAAVMASFVIGAAVSLLVLLPLPWYRRLYTQLRKRGLREGGGTFTMESEVPFGPFLIAGALTVWLLRTLDISLLQLLLF